MPLDDALDLMFEHELDCIVVRDARGRVEGIFTAVDALEAIGMLSRDAGPRSIAKFAS
jgi:CBS domain-containing protein